MSDTEIVGLWLQRADGTRLKTDHLLDPVTLAVKVLDVPHHEIHEGRRFLYSELITLAQAGVRDLLLTTPDSARAAHFTFEIEANGECTVEVFEAVTVSSAGTAASAINRNRNSVIEPTATLTHTPTVTGTGTRLIHAQLNVGGTGSSRVGAVGARQELILKRNARTLLRITAAGNGTDVNVLLDWYEHEEA